jgi:hypothetical protein
MSQSVKRLTTSASPNSPGIDEHILAGPSLVDNTLETKVKRAMKAIQHTSTNTIDTGGIACGYLRSPRRLGGRIADDQHRDVGGDQSEKTYSMERNKNTLELKTARDGPAATNFSHVLEAVILKAAKDRIKMLSRTRTTDVSYVGKRAQARKWGDLTHRTR